MKIQSVRNFTHLKNINNTKNSIQNVNLSQSSPVSFTKNSERHNFGDEIERRVFESYSSDNSNPDKKALIEDIIIEIIRQEKLELEKYLKLLPETERRMQKNTEGANELIESLENYDETHKNGRRDYKFLDKMRRSIVSKTRIAENHVLDIEGQKQAIETLEKRIASWTIVLNRMQAGDKFAYIEAEETTIAQKARLASLDEDLINLVECAKKIGTKPKVLSNWKLMGKVNTFDLTGGLEQKFINLTDEDTVNFLNEMQTRIPKAYDSEYLTGKFGLKPSEITEAWQKGKLRALGYNEKPLGIASSYVLFDSEDEVNADFIEKYKRCHPLKSEKYFVNYGKTVKIPASYLSRLGFGDTPTLRKLVQEGKIDGEIKTVPTKEGKRTATFVNVSENSTTRTILKNLRNSNKNIVSVDAYTKDYNFTPAAFVNKVKQDLMDGKVEAISEYIFNDDERKIYIDISNPKNAEYLASLR